MVRLRPVIVVGTVFDEVDDGLAAGQVRDGLLSSRSWAAAPAIASATNGSSIHATQWATAAAASTPLTAAIIPSGTTRLFDLPELWLPGCDHGARLLLHILCMGTWHAYADSFPYNDAQIAPWHTEQRTRSRLP